LVDLLLCTGALADAWDDAEEVGEVLGGLSSASLGGPVLNRLRTMRDDPHLAETVRIECAVALGKLVAPEEAAEWLTRFAEDAGLTAIRRSVSALGELVPDGLARAERVLVRTADHRNDHLTVMAVTQLMLEHEMTDAAARLVGALCATLRADPAVRPGADLPLPPGAARIADTVGDSAVGWGVLADLAVRSGRADDADWAITLVLAVPNVPEEDFVLAVAAAADRGRAADILSSAEVFSTSHLTWAAQRLHERGHQAFAVDLARRALARSTIDGSEFHSAAYVLTECGAKAELLRTVEEADNLRAEHFAQLARLLTGLGEVPAIAERLRAALAEPLIGPYDFAFIAEVLLASGDHGTAEEVHRLAAGLDPRHQTEAAEILCRAGHVDLGRGLIVDMLVKGVRMEVFSDLLGEEILGNDKIGLTDELLAAIADVLPDVAGYQHVHLIEGLSRIGRTEEAIAAARRAVRTNIDRTWLDTAVEAWLAIGGAAAADEILTEVLTRDVLAKYRLEVAEAFAKEGLLDAAVAVWLDVVRHHGDAIAHGVEAASRLVGCGNRDTAIATLDTALADDRLARPAKNSLRALRAWMTA
jgi:tetratricopeptide (TPR) repeat protein